MAGSRGIFLLSWVTVPKNTSMKTSLILLLSLLYLSACNPATGEDSGAQDAAFRVALEQHLEAVTTKNFAALKETVPASGELIWILPNGASFNKAEDFLQNHQTWLQEPQWTMTTRIIQADWGSDYGTATVEADLREPERNGKPYFHRMFITYALKKMDGKWLVVMDHASTIEKSE